MFSVVCYMLIVMLSSVNDLMLYGWLLFHCWSLLVVRWLSHLVECVVVVRCLLCVGFVLHVVWCALFVC